METRRQTLKRIGAGTGAVVVPGQTSGKATNANDKEIEKSKSTFVIVEQKVASLPSDAVPMSGGGEYPHFEDGEGTSQDMDQRNSENNGSSSNQGKITISEVSYYPNFDMAEGFMVADSNNGLVSYPEDETHSISQSATGLHTDTGQAFVGKLQDRLNIVPAGGADLDNPNSILVETKNGENVVSPNGSVIIDEEHTVTYRNESSKTVESTIELQFEISNNGNTQVIGHPNKMLVPTNHRYAGQAERLRREVDNNGGPVETAGGEVTCKYDNRYGVYTIAQEFGGDD